MASEVVVALIGGAAGLFAGAIGSLFAPWSQWGVEKRRLRRDSRVQRLAEWRAGIAVLDEQAETYKHYAYGYDEDHPSVDHTDVNRELLALQYMLNVERFAWFQSLSHYLAAEVDTKVRAPQDHFRPTSDGSTEALSDEELAKNVVRLLLTEVARIEREWDLG